MKHRLNYSLETCPDRSKHTKAPSGYLEWHSWATRKARTHRQTQCDTCRLWAIWIPKQETPR